MTTAQRWNRLTATIADADLPVTTLSSRNFPGGVGFFVSSRLPSGDRVEIHDQWWRKNPDVWVGYVVHIEGPDNIVRRQWSVTKKRSEVVAAIREALEMAA